VPEPLSLFGEKGGNKQRERSDAQQLTCWATVGQDPDSKGVMSAGADSGVLRVGFEAKGFPFPPGRVWSRY
jgi:hypothetical protein